MWTHQVTSTLVLRVPHTRGSDRTMRGTQPSMEARRGARRRVSSKGRGGGGFLVSVWRGLGFMVRGGKTQQVVVPEPATSHDVQQSSLLPLL